MNVKGFLAVALASAMATGAILGAWPSVGSDGHPPVTDVTYLTGDWYVDAAEARANEIIVLTGNIIVNGTGLLEFRNVTLRMNCAAADGQFRIEVRTGGAFYVNDTDNNSATTAGASVLTNSNSASYGFAFQVNESATFEMRNSVLRKCGTLVSTAGASTSGPVLRSSSAKIIGSEIYGCANGLVIDSCNVTVSNSTIRNNKFSGVLFTNATAADFAFGASVSGCAVRDNGLDGISAAVRRFDGSFTDNVVTANARDGIRLKVWETADVSFDSNVIGNNGLGGVCIYGQPNAASISADFTGNNISYNDETPVKIGYLGASVEEIPSKQVFLNFTSNDIFSSGSAWGFLMVIATETINANVNGNDFIDLGVSNGVHVGKLTKEINDTPGCRNVSVIFDGNELTNYEAGAFRICATERLNTTISNNHIYNTGSGMTCGAVTVGFFKVGTDLTTPKHATVTIRNNTIDNVALLGAITVKSIYTLNATVENNTITNSNGFGIKLGWATDGEYGDAPSLWALPTRSVKAKVCHNSVTGKSGPGIWIYSSNGSEVFENDVSSKIGTSSLNPGDGIRMQSSNNLALVHDNRVIGCALSGIRLYKATNAKVYHNTLTGNAYGLGLDAISSGNVLYGNVVSKTASQYGYYLATDSLNNAIEANNSVSGSYLKLRYGLHGTPGSPISVSGLTENVPLMSNLGQIVVGYSSFLDISNINAGNGSAGLCLVNVTDSLVRGNSLHDNLASTGYGINLMLGSNRNSLRGNAMSNNLRGIGLNTYSSNNNLWSNSMSKSSSQYGLWFDWYSMYLHNEIPTNNTANGSPIRYFHSETGAALNGLTVTEPLLTNLGQVVAYNCPDLVLSNLTVSGTGSPYGIYLRASNGASVKDSTITGCTVGINGIDSAGISLDNVSISGGSKGLMISNGNATMESCAVGGASTLVTAISASISASNSSFSSALGTAFDLTTGSALRMLNTTFQRNSASISNDSMLSASWYLAVKASSNGKGFVTGVNITGVNGTTTISDNTDPSGWIRDLTVQEFEQTGNSINIYSPYWVNASKPGFGNFSALVPGDSSTTVLANLSDLSAPATVAGPTLSATSAFTSTAQVWLNATYDDNATGNGTIAAAEYTVSPTFPAIANGSGIEMTAADGALDSPRESVSAAMEVTGWSHGVHTIWAHGRDSAGNWCPWISVHLTITDDLGPAITIGPSIGPSVISSETGFIWLNFTADDKGFGNSAVTGCALSVSDSQGVLAPQQFQYVATAADGVFDEANETVTVRIDKTLWHLGRYSMVLRGKDASDNLGVPSYLNVTVLDNTPPSPPTGLTASNQSGNGTLLLNWSGVTDGDLAGYRLYRSYLSGRGFVPIANLSANETFWLDEGLIPGVKYYYFVSSFDKTVPPNVSPGSAEAWGIPSDQSNPGGDGNQTDDADQNHSVTTGAVNWELFAAVGTLGIFIVVAVAYFLLRRKRSKGQ